MQKAYEDGLVVQTKPGAVPSLKRYLDEMKGNPVDTIWDDIKPVQAKSKERLGYPTQKPLALLDRIIKASSNEDDVILDPFAGCATACVAAERRHRDWVGIDLSPLAARLVKSRLQKEMGLFYDVDHREDIPRPHGPGRNPQLPDAQAHAVWQAGGHLWWLPDHVPVPQYDRGSHHSAGEGWQQPY